MPNAKPLRHGVQFPRGVLMAPPKLCTVAAPAGRPGWAPRKNLVLAASPIFLPHTTPPCWPNFKPSRSQPTRQIPSSIGKCLSEILTKATDSAVLRLRQRRAQCHVMPRQTASENNSHTNVTETCPRLDIESGTNLTPHNPVKIPVSKPSQKPATQFALWLRAQSPAALTTCVAKQHFA